MRIAQVVLRFDAPGGVETTVRELSSRLARTGESVEVLASDLYDEARWERRGDFPPSVDGVPVHRFPVYRRLVPGLTMPLMVGLVDALARGPADLIHAHSHRYGHVLEAALAARARRIPLVVSTHYHPADRREPMRKRGLLRIQDHLFGWSAYRIARALVTESRREAELLAEFAPADRIRVIPPGIDLDLWRAEEPEPTTTGLPARYLLYTGRIASNKGLPLLMSALARIPREECLPLVLMGRDWGARPGIEALARELGIADRLLWIGHVGDPVRYRAIFRGASLFVLPSEWEAFGLVLLEAMAAGVPIVATEVGAVPEVLDGGAAGKLVPYGDPDRLADAIRNVTLDPQAARTLAARGRTRVLEFGWDRAVEAHRALYREILGSRAS